jgi:hypothetical protein
MNEHAASNAAMIEAILARGLRLCLLTKPSALACHHLQWEEADSPKHPRFFRLSQVWVTHAEILSTFEYDTWRKKSVDVTCYLLASAGSSSSEIFYYSTIVSFLIWLTIVQWYTRHFPTLNLYRVLNYCSSRACVLWLQVATRATKLDG